MIWLTVLLALLPVLLKWLGLLKRPPTADEALFLKRHMLFAKETFDYLASPQVANTMNGRELRRLAKAKALYAEVAAKAAEVGCACE